MGTDIHLFIERFNGSAWAPVLSQDYRGFSQTSWDVGRHYDLFSILADVRNGFGFAGVPTGGKFLPILAFLYPDMICDGEYQGRGLPEDLSQELRSLDGDPNFDDYVFLGDYGYSWITLAEIDAAMEKGYGQLQRRDVNGDSYSYESVMSYLLDLLNSKIRPLADDTNHIRLVFGFDS